MKRSGRVEMGLRLEFVYTKKVTDGERFGGVGMVETLVVEPEGGEHCGLSGGVEELGEHGVGVVLGTEVGVGWSTLGMRVARNFFAFKTFSDGVSIDVE